MRTGNEPVTARSPLRMRWWLSVWGLIWTAFGTIAFAVVGRPGWAIACGVLMLIVVTDFLLVVRHKRQGSRYQPGRDVPPYRARDDRDGHERDHGRDHDGSSTTGSTTNGTTSGGLSRRSRSGRP
ncbi:DUF6343 family protein [Streptomyces sp. NBC_01498]|uniref:DUF6343 family protein n=1 Tax=Streptomyces sp. NBC_01498 TaxID=2975870 RepID=UPI002E7B1F71|nr:DUF6343 family protein [Streptomyces sp. NBC_01498]WTL27418.1 DUF6343 family protein [Streptomyces sp. NBC_01498]